MLRSQRLFFVALELFGLFLIAGGLLGGGTSALAFDPTKLTVIGKPINMNSGYSRSQSGSSDKEEKTSSSASMPRGERTFRDSKNTPAANDSGPQRDFSDAYVSRSSSYSRASSRQNGGDRGSRFDRGGLDDQYVQPSPVMNRPFPSESSFVGKNANGQFFDSQRFADGPSLDRAAGGRAGVSSPLPGNAPRFDQPNMEGPQDILSEADAAYQNGRFNDAESLYQQYLAQNSTIGDRSTVSIAYHRLGLIARKRQQYEKAMDYLVKAVQASPMQNSEITFDYARILYDIGQYDRAEKLLAHLYQDNPSDQQVKFYLAQSTLRLRRYSEAYKLLKESVGREDACAQIAKQANEQGDTEVAEEMKRYLLQVNMNKDQQFFLGENAPQTVSDPVFPDPTAVPVPAAELAMAVPKAGTVGSSPKPDSVPTSKMKAAQNPGPIPVPDQPEGEEASISKLFLPAFTQYLDGEGANPVSEEAFGEGTVVNSPMISQNVVPSVSPMPQDSHEESYSAAYQSTDAWLGNSHPGLSAASVPGPVPAASPMDSAEEEDIWASSKSFDHRQETEFVPTTQNRPSRKKSSEEKLAEAIAAGATVEYLTPEQYNHEIATRAGTLVREAKEEARAAAAKQRSAPSPL